MRRLLHALLTGGTVALIAQPALAAQLCVGTTAELRAALQTAQASAADDEIRMRVGTYAIDSTLFYVNQVGGWLVVVGGYQDGGGLPCGARVLNAGATVLDGLGVRNIMVLSYQPPAASTTGVRIYIDNLTFRNGVGTGFQRGSGLNISVTGANANNEVWLENLVFRNNSGYFAGGLDVYAVNGLVRVVNSLFDGNQAPDTAFGHLAINVLATAPAVDRAIVVVNSTFANGTCAGSAGTGYTRGCGIYFGLGTGLSGEIANSVFWNNAIADVTIESNVANNGSERGFLRDTLAATVNGNVTRVVSSAISGDPQFVDAAAGNFQLLESSPLVNRGVLPIPGSYPQFNFHDVAGAVRNRFGAIDVGAFELQTLDPVFRNGFED